MTLDTHLKRYSISLNFNIPNFPRYIYQLRCILGNKKYNNVFCVGVIKNQLDMLFWLFLHDLFVLASININKTIMFGKLLVWAIHVDNYLNLSF